MDDMVPERLKRNHVDPASTLSTRCCPVSLMNVSTHRRHVPSLERFRLWRPSSSSGFLADFSGGVDRTFDTLWVFTQNKHNPDSGPRQPCSSFNIVQHFGTRRRSHDIATTQRSVRASSCIDSGWFNIPGSAVTVPRWGRLRDAHH